MMNVPGPGLDDLYNNTVEEYFALKAAEYDLADLQPYWRLSDRLLLELLTDHIVSQLPPDARLLDVGGGTGRWTDHLLRLMPNATAVVIDRSREMLDQATAKATSGGYADRATFERADLNNPSTLAVDRIGEFDLAFSFHNVLGFVADPNRIVTQMGEATSEGGMLALVVPSTLHAAFFALYRGDVAEAEEILRTDRGRFTTDMPPIHMFREDWLMAACSTSGYVDVAVRGFPCLLYPGVEETQVEGSTGSIAGLLDADGFDRVSALEQMAVHRHGSASRGANLFVSGRMRRIARSPRQV